MGGITVPDPVRAGAILLFVLLGVGGKIKPMYAVIGAAASWYFLLPKGVVTVCAPTCCGAGVSS